MEGGEMEPKAKLVEEICFISTLFASCAHLRSNARKKVFVDCYLILKVDENSGFHVIRGQYLQLALQLHPDKNEHPKAEIAFKLISEAYACLSDKARRKNFDAARRSSFCGECYQKWQSTQHVKNKDSSDNNNNEHENKPRTRRTANRARQCKILQALKQVQNQFREECCVIENCLKLKTNNMNGCERESPLFDPYDHIGFSGYPYQRASMATGKPPGNCFFQPEADCGQPPPNESPIYQIRSNVWAKRTTKTLF